MNPEVTIEVSSQISNKYFSFIFSHNGRLQRLERIVQSTIENSATYSGRDYDNEMASQLGVEISRLFFTPSHLINDDNNEADDGSVVSMDLVKKKLAMYGGKTKIVFTSFSLS